MGTQTPPHPATGSVRRPEQVAPPPTHRRGAKIPRLSFSVSRFRSNQAAEATSILADRETEARDLGSSLGRTRPG